MLAVDLNADLGEGATLTPNDIGVLDAVTSASIACGFHAGNRDVMHATALACLERDVTIGAHVSYRDREGFGRRNIDVDRARLVDEIVEQCETLGDVVAAVGGAISYLKPHGALYTRMVVDPDVAAAVIEAASDQAIGVLVSQSTGDLDQRARGADLRLVAEGFPDRAYRPDGRLVPRTVDGAVVGDRGEVARRALGLAVRGGVEAITGEWTRVPVETLCIHGDEPEAARTARDVRDALEAADVVVRPFVVAPSRRAPGDLPGP